MFDACAVKLTVFVWFSSSLFSFVVKLLRFVQGTCDFIIHLLPASSHHGLHSCPYKQLAVHAASGGNGHVLSGLSVRMCYCQTQLKVHVFCFPNAAPA